MVVALVRTTVVSSWGTDPRGSDWERHYVSSVIRREMAASCLPPGFLRAMSLQCFRRGASRERAVERLRP